MSALFTYYKVSCKFDWDNTDSNCDSYSFGSLEGAREWVDRHMDSLSWYSIEGLSAYPCDKDNEGGQLYYGIDYHKFEELKNKS